MPSQSYPWLRDNLAAFTYAATRPKGIDILWTQCVRGAVNVWAGVNAALHPPSREPWLTWHNGRLLDGARRLIGKYTALQCPR
jgi:hypothetical protein